MFELTEIMWQRDSKVFPELLNYRLCESKRTASDVVKLKERVVQEDENNPFDAPHLYKQNAN